MPIRHILRSIAVLLGMAILLLSVSVPATAHEKHKKSKPVAEQVLQPQPGTEPAPQRQVAFDRQWP